MRFAPLALIALASVASEAATPYSSWGMAGVTFDRYRTDAIACGRLGANKDISGEPATARVVLTERLVERLLNAGIQEGTPIVDGYADIHRRLQPRQSIAEVQQVHVDAVATCLLRLGYSRFALTPAQTKALGRLRAGTAERHRFLHALASDPAVLARQTIG